MSDIHAAARQGFGKEAITYARGRPEYPTSLLPWLRHELGLTTGKTVLDLGSGTGKFTKLLVQTGAQVLAVEPVASMREQFAQNFPTLTQYEGTAQAIPLASASVDAVLCAQAFHWFATEAALAEIRRVLRPGGKLGLVWNVRDESADWVAAITRIITPFEGDAPRFHKGDWRQAFGSGLFGDLAQTSFAYQHQGTAQEVIMDRFLSVSFIAILPPTQKAVVENQLRDLIARARPGALGFWHELARAFRHRHPDHAPLAAVAVPAGGAGHAVSGAAHLAGDSDVVFRRAVP